MGEGCWLCGIGGGGGGGVGVSGGGGSGDDVEDVDDDVKNQNITEQADEQINQ